MKTLIMKIKKFFHQTYRVLSFIATTSLFVLVVLVGSYYFIPAEKTTAKSQIYSFDKGYAVGSCSAGLALSQRMPETIAVGICNCFVDKLEQSHGPAVFRNFSIVPERELIAKLRSCLPKQPRHRPQRPQLPENY